MELGPEQIRQATKYGTSKFPEAPRLISTSESHRRVDFIQSILYHVVKLSFRITKVLKVTIYLFVHVYLSVYLSDCLSLHNNGLLAFFYMKQAVAVFVHCSDCHFHNCQSP